MWAGLNGFDPRTDLEFGGVRIGMDCMNLVTVISGYTRVPVTLIEHSARKECNVQRFVMFHH